MSLSTAPDRAGFQQMAPNFKLSYKAAVQTSLVVQWLRLQAPNAGGLGLIPGQEIRFNMPQLRICMP